MDSGVAHFSLSLPCIDALTMFGGNAGNRPLLNHTPSSALDPHNSTTLFGEAAERHRQARDSPFSGEDIRALFADLKIRLEDSFCFTAEQKANIRIITQDIIFQPTRTGFKSINIEVKKTLQTEKENMRLMNVFGGIGDKLDTAYTFHIVLLVFNLHEF
ncbi:hypothetical protein SERLADRAFT_463750 [Serpula lacrymans var. lacrymans S7.9]|uniref:Uncharacterized protein n=1 Tax=Serpula lacrymans var. lacrymans (strain S7.9) TaxID=578457 RepID=F8NQA2_SERL9|nr:uncharacterized protein SERLADRAFT_463750 [Serpula lacrymans var. lacrymans S7.9]EGO26562.1 hypothetical protein SERLADRAFT_463750 [Serpula lacrymans var. lacrymans S7.9]